MVKREVLKRLEQIDDAALQFTNPARVFRERPGQPVEHTLLESRVVYDHRSSVADAVPQAVQEFRPRITAPVSEKGTVLRLCARRGLPAHAELKWHLLVRTQADEQRNCHAERIEVEVTDWELQAFQVAGQRSPADVRLARQGDPALDRLPRGQVNSVRNVAEPDNAVAQQAPAF